MLPANYMVFQSLRHFMINKISNNGAFMMRHCLMNIFFLINQLMIFKKYH